MSKKDYYTALLYMINSKLDNPEFLKKAPKHIIELEIKKKNDVIEILKNL
jgi:valyl-tRNA synthetase